VPLSCPGVPEDILNPRNTWNDKEAYDRQADRLAGLFNDNFRQYEDQVPDLVKSAGPRSGVSVK
jgi:phosphoenolpyruvate carboxykinase (ATP)